MALPWDEANVPRNLQVIASLRSGDKLSVPKKGANPTHFSNLGKKGRGLREIFDRQQGGFWAGKRELERMKSTYRKSGLQHRRKMHQILSTINPLIPRVGAGSCIPVNSEIRSDPISEWRVVHLAGLRGKQRTQILG